MPPSGGFFMQHLTYYLEIIKDADHKADLFFANVEREALSRYSQQDTPSRLSRLQWQIGYLQGTIRALMQNLAVEKAPEFTEKK